MILSMTGYGTGSAQKDSLTVSTEIRTVNHRFLDLHVRLPREYLFLEGEIQQMIRKALDRGRAEVTVTIQNSAVTPVSLNSSLLKGYLEAAGKLKQELNLQDSLDLKTLLSLPGILQSRESLQPEDAQIVSELLETCVRQALEGVLEMRRNEGLALRTEMARILNLVADSTRNIRRISVDSPGEVLEKLRERLSQLLPEAGIDPQRLAQEAALLADKADISEEIARLESHLEQFRQLVDGEEKAGKRLDFLLQEMHREANTILSKSGNLEISRSAIAVKADIEKLREQVQNVE